MILDVGALARARARLSAQYNRYFSLQKEDTST